jgi:hypothetical protein
MDVAFRLDKSHPRNPTLRALPFTYPLPSDDPNIECFEIEAKGQSIVLSPPPVEPPPLPEPFRALLDARNPTVRPKKKKKTLYDHLLDDDDE